VWHLPLSFLPYWNKEKIMDDNVKQFSKRELTAAWLAGWSEALHPTIKPKPDGRNIGSETTQEVRDHLLGKWAGKTFKKKIEEGTEDGLERFEKDRRITA